MDTEQIPTGDTERHTDNRRYQSTTDNCRYQAVSDTDRTTRPNKALFTCERHKLIKTVLFPLSQAFLHSFGTECSDIGIALKKTENFSPVTALFGYPLYDMWACGPISRYAPTGFPFPFPSPGSNPIISLISFKAATHSFFGKHQWKLVQQLALE